MMGIGKNYLLKKVEYANIIKNEGGYIIIQGYR